MKALKTKTLLTLLLFLPLLNPAQEKNCEAEVVSFSSIPAEGKLYFKITVKGLENDTRLILEKKVMDEKETAVIDTQKGVGTDVEIPLLYSFKDNSPKDRSTLYRLRGIRFLENGKTESWTLAEKRFPKGLLGMKGNK